MITTNNKLLFVVLTSFGAVRDSRKWLIWKVNRMSKVDLNILRLAVYEMKYDEDVPLKVAINEAVELSKKFGGDESSSFVNGILGKIAKEQ